MKVNLSERSAEKVLRLYEASGMDCKLTHFLNLLITSIPEDHTILSNPAKEDNNYDQKRENL
jgi:hypothetical protein